MEFMNEMIQWLKITCFITGWISVFEWISWMNDSKTNTFSNHSSFLPPKTTQELIGGIEILQQVSDSWP